MRTSLLPGVLETVARNINFRSLDLRLFEMRRVYLPKSGEEMPHEPIFVVGALTGSRERQGWCQSADLVDFYDAKGVVENILELIHIDGVKWVADTPEPYYHPGKSCSIMVGRDRIGSLGEIHPTVLETFGLDKPLYCFELDFEKLLSHVRQQSAITVPSRYPDSFRDMALLVPDETSSERIIECIKGIKAEEIDQVEIFDVYRGTGIAEGFKSIAVRVRYRSYERTLLDDEISSIHSKILDSLVNNVKVSIR